MYLANVPGIERLPYLKYYRSDARPLSFTRSFRIKIRLHLPQAVARPLRTPLHVIEQAGCDGKSVTQ